MNKILIRSRNELREASEFEVFDAKMYRLFSIPI